MGRNEQIRVVLYCSISCLQFMDGAVKSFKDVVMSQLTWKGRACCIEMML